MPIRLIALDLDGTLLDDEKRLPPHFYEIAGYLLDSGIKVVIASGRQYQNLYKSFAPLAERLTFMSENGALMFEHEACVVKHPLPRQQLLDYYHAALAIPTATPLMAGIHSCYLKPNVVKGFPEEVAKYYEARTVSDEAERLAFETDEIVKVAMYDTESTEKNCLPKLASFQKDFQISLSALHWMDAMPKGVNKGVALSGFMRQNNLVPEECMAFGDYLNDMEMLDVVKYGYAMENSHPSVLANAKYLAPKNTENGVMRTLAKHFPELQKWVGTEKKG